MKTNKLTRELFQELCDKNNEMNNYITKLKQHNKLFLCEAAECQGHYTKKTNHSIYSKQLNNFIKQVVLVRNS